MGWEWGFQMHFLTFLDKSRNSKAELDNERINHQFRITGQKMKFSIKDFFSKCDQICRKLRICSYLLKKFLMENFIFCAVYSF